MPAQTAIFRTTTVNPSQVDRDKGVVYGCQLAKVGKLATFADLDGKKKELLVTPSLINGLLAICSADERQDGHWTHDWLSTNADPLNATVATWRNFRKDNEGNLIADAFLWPTSKKEAILHAAENDPKGMMVSMVFDYTGGRDNAVAQSVRACDFVQKGAATTALCKAILSAIPADSNPTTKIPMDINDLLQALQDPQVLDALKAVIKSVESNQADDELDTAEMENAAGVTDADKKPEDDQQPAIMRAALRVHRATIRQAKELVKTSETAILTKAEAKVTSVIGSNPAIRDFGKGNEHRDAFENAIQTAIAAGAKDRSTAILRVAKDKPEIYNAHMAAINKR